MKNKKDVGNNHEKNTIAWVCYVANVRKRRFVKQIMHSRKKIDILLYGILMDSIKDEGNPLLSQDQVDRLFYVAKEIPTSIIK